jgi:hypothetical protein
MKRLGAVEPVLSFQPYQPDFSRKLKRVESRVVGAIP